LNYGGHRAHALASIYIHFHLLIAVEYAVS